MVDAVDDFTGHAVGDSAIDIDAERLLLDTGLVEQGAQLVMPRDTGAAAAQARSDSLVDMHIPALAEQHVGDEQAADGTADHYSFHRTAFTSCLLPLGCFHPVCAAEYSQHVLSEQVCYFDIR